MLGKRCTDCGHRISFRTHIFDASHDMRCRNSPITVEADTEVFTLRERRRERLNALKL